MGGSLAACAGSIRTGTPPDNPLPHRRPASQIAPPRRQSRRGAPDPEGVDGRRQGGATIDQVGWLGSKLRG